MNSFCCDLFGHDRLSLLVQQLYQFVTLHFLLSKVLAVCEDVYFFASNERYLHIAHCRVLLCSDIETRQVLHLILLLFKKNCLRFEVYLHCHTCFNDCPYIPTLYFKCKMCKSVLKGDFSV